MIDIKLTDDEARAIVLALALEHETLVDHIESEPDDKKAVDDLSLIEQIATKLHALIQAKGI